MLLFIIGFIVETALLGAAIYFLFNKKAGGGNSKSTELELALNERREVKEEIEKIISEMVSVDELHGRTHELLTMKESARMERGRVTITQAELETLETRLRELEEIERELEASGIETKEELKILNKKEKELAAKNEQLKAQINASAQQMEATLKELEVSSQVQEEIDSIKLALLQTQERIDTLLEQIEQGNEHYFTLKQRYDALDIEYAQLFERFSEAEAALNAEQKS